MKENRSIRRVIPKTKRITLTKFQVGDLIEITLIKAIEPKKE